MPNWFSTWAQDKSLPGFPGGQPCAKCLLICALVLLAVFMLGVRVGRH